MLLSLCGGVIIEGDHRMAIPLCSLVLPSEEMCGFVLPPMPHHDVLASPDPKTKGLLSHGRDPPKPVS